MGGTCQKNENVCWRRRAQGIPMAGNLIFSVKETGEFGSQMTQYARFGEIHGVHADAEFRSDSGSWSVVDDKFPARLPGDWLEIRLRNRQRTPNQVIAVFGFLDDHARISIGYKIRVPVVCRCTTELALVLAPCVQEHGLEPRPETLSGVVAKLWEVFNQQNKDILYEVGGIGFIQTDTTTPIEHKRGIQIDESTPSRGIPSRGESLQKAGRCRGHVAQLLDGTQS